MRNKLLVAGTLALAMTCTTVFSSITPAVVKAASVSTVQTQTAENSDDYVYCYAGLTWAEYWKAEGVMAAGDTIPRLLIQLIHTMKKIKVPLMQ